MADDHVCPADPWVRPASDLDSLHANITDALSQLRKARAAYEHSPNQDTQRDIDLCDWRLDHLLARQKATTQKTAAV